MPRTTPPPIRANATNDQSQENTDGDAAAAGNIKNITAHPSITPVIAINIPGVHEICSFTIATEVIFGLE